MVDKNILRDYIDARGLIKETEEDIRKLKQQRKTIVTDSVKGSMHEFPYAAQNFKIAGISHTVLEHPGELKRQETILTERKANAERVKTQVEAWLNTIPMRMQRIVKMKYFEKKTWGEVAKQIGRNATADGVRMEFDNFIKKIK